MVVLTCPQCGARRNAMAGFRLSVEALCDHCVADAAVHKWIIDGRPTADSPKRQPQDDSESTIDTSRDPLII